LLPSAENYFADRLSRTWDPSDLTVRACNRREVLSAYARVVLSGSGVWEYRPLGVHLVAIRKVSRSSLGERWGSESARLYCPLVDLIIPTMRKIKRERARGVLLVPNWEVASWMPTVVAEAAYWVCWRQGPRELWTGKRVMNPALTLRVVEIRI
jgi:hypothetical protein